MTADAGEACVFCRILGGELTPGVVAFRNVDTAVFPSLHQQPRNPGHMLVVPIRHVPRIWDLDLDLAGSLLTTVARVAAAVKRAGRADGVSIRQNNDRHGDQDVPHIHFHVVPRFADDGFTRGERPFPLGAVEVPLAERIEQARRLAEALGPAGPDSSGQAG